MEVGGGRTAGGADLGDGDAGEEVCAEGDCWLAEEVAVGDDDVAVFQFDVVAGSVGVACCEDFAGEHGEDGGALWCGEVEAGVKFGERAVEGVATLAVRRCYAEFDSQRRVAPKTRRKGILLRSCVGSSDGCTAFRHCFVSDYSEGTIAFRIYDGKIVCIRRDIPP